jgi:hypothetical protein
MRGGRQFRHLKALQFRSRFFRWRGGLIFAKEWVESPSDVFAPVSKQQGPYLLVFEAQIALIQRAG